LNSIQVYSLAIGANLAFSTASMVFAIFAKRFSSMWINQFKVVIALIAFFIGMILSGNIASLTFGSTSFLLLSGLSGLCIGDIFLFKAYTTLGAGRSLILFSFQPLLLGLYGYLFLGQIFTLNQTLSVIAMIICIFIFMFERNKLTGAWDLKSFSWAFIGICFDAVGVMLTRTSYELNPDLQTFQVNLIRALGAMVGFILINPKSYPVIFKDVISLSRKDLMILFTATFCGCFLSLTLYLAALKHAHIGTLTAISITGPVWVSMLECLYHRKLPNPYLLTAFSFFLVGFYLMIS
jgi:drug/metabolite transporter (DMT)-like permease